MRLCFSSESLFPNDDSEDANVERRLPNVKPSIDERDELSDGYETLLSSGDGVRRSNMTSSPNSTTSF